MAPYSIPVEVYRRLEEIIGKEAAGIVVDALQESIRASSEESGENLRIGITDDLKHEMASKSDLSTTKAELKAELQWVKTELQQEIKLVKTELNKEIEMVKTDLQKEINKLRVEVKKDIKIMGIILLAVIIILNQNSTELLGKILGIIK